MALKSPVFHSEICFRLGHVAAAVGVLAVEVVAGRVDTDRSCDSYSHDSSDGERESKKFANSHQLQHHSLKRQGVD